MPTRTDAWSTLGPKEGLVITESWRAAPNEVATLLRELPWSAHVDLLGRCAMDAGREFYLRNVLRENQSVRDLRRAIDTATFERVALADGKIATLSRVFPEESRRHFKDSYVVEFLGLPVTHCETGLRRALVHRHGHFLRELGRDFSFIGEEYPIQVGTRDGSIDLLFFHRGLNCLVAIELKSPPSSPRTSGSSTFTSKRSTAMSASPTKTTVSASCSAKPKTTRSWNMPSAVGVGRVKETVQSVNEFRVETDAGERPCLEVLQHADHYRQHAHDADKAEYFVRVDWSETVSTREAFWEVGLFGNQNTVCQPSTQKWRHTIEWLKTRFRNWDAQPG